MDDESRITLDAAALRDAAPYLVRDALEPGDIIVTRGRAVHSGFIAWVTKGQYSHAAIWWPEQPGGSMGVLAEADGFGVGLSHLFGTRVDGKWLLPLEAESVAVLRHRGMTGVGEGTVRQAMKILEQEYFFQSYSDIARLPEVVRRAEALKGPARAFLNLYDRLRRREDRISGTFCSELVAVFYRELGLPLGRGEPEAHSPNDFVRASDTLEPVAGAVVVANDISDNATAEIYTSEIGKYFEREMARERVLPRMVTLSGTGYRYWKLGQGIRQLNHELCAHLDSQMDEALAMAKARHEELRRDFSKAQTENDARSIASLQQLLAESHALLDGYLGLLALSVDFRRADPPDPRLSEEWQLRMSQWMHTSSSLGYKQLRQRILWGIREFRAMAGQITAQGKTPPVDEGEYRRAVLQPWIDLAADRRATQRLLSEAEAGLRELAAKAA